MAIKYNFFLVGSTYTKIGTIQRRLAWPLRKDDTQNREAFHIFCTQAYQSILLDKIIIQEKYVAQFFFRYII